MGRGGEGEYNLNRGRILYEGDIGHVQRQGDVGIEIMLEAGR